MIGHCLGRMESRIKKCTPHTVFAAPLVTMPLVTPHTVFAGVYYNAHTARMKAVDFTNEITRMIDSGEMDLAKLGRRGSGADGSPRLPQEITRSCVTLITELGKGNFGSVWKGMLDESARTGVPGYLVAVKQVHDSSIEAVSDLIHEAALMAQLDAHPNLVSIVGVVTAGDPLLLVLCYCEHGSLYSVLRQGARDGAVFESEELQLMSLQIARGMGHLSQYFIVHRDLATRNVLVDSTYCCKVADFGMSRVTATATGLDAAGTSDYISTKGLVPARWSAPEALMEQRFSSQSDVWSFGIAVVELFTFAETPYPDMTIEDVCRHVPMGYRHPCPPRLQHQLYRTIVLPCFATHPVDRPTFADLERTLCKQLDIDTEADARGVLTSPRGSTAAGCADPDPDLDAGRRVSRLSSVQNPYAIERMKSMPGRRSTVATDPDSCPMTYEYHDVVQRHLSDCQDISEGTGQETYAARPLPPVRLVSLPEYENTREITAQAAEMQSITSVVSSERGEGCLRVSSNDSEYADRRPTAAMQNTSESVYVFPGDVAVPFVHPTPVLAEPTARTSHHQHGPYIEVEATPDLVAPQTSHSAPTVSYVGGVCLCLRAWVYVAAAAAAAAAGQCGLVHACMRACVRVGGDRMWF